MSIPKHADVCIPRLPPGVTAAELAASYFAEGSDKKEAAADRRVLWQPGQVLRTRFLDGTPKMHAAVAKIAKTWEQHANITFDFGDFATAEIRITFRHPRPGYWSYLGREALEVDDQGECTMSLTNGWDDEFVETEVVRTTRTVLHEIGHALGLVHEHQSPAASIPWDEEKVYQHYARTQGWDRAKVEAQVLKPEGGPYIRYTEHDPKSIMQYPVEGFLTVGGFEIPWNDVLSPVDIEMIGVLYPRE